MSWGGNAQNLAITGASWVVSDFLVRTAAPAKLGLAAGDFMQPRP